MKESIPHNSLVLNHLSLDISNTIMDVASDLEHDIRLKRTECNMKWFKRLHDDLFFEVTLSVGDVIDASMPESV